MNHHRITIGVGDDCHVANGCLHRLKSELAAAFSETTHRTIEIVHFEGGAATPSRRLPFWSSNTDSERACSDIIFNKSLIPVPEEPYLCEAQSGLIELSRPLQVGNGIDCKCDFDEAKRLINWGNWSLLIGPFRSRSVWRMFIKRLSIPHTALKELRPVRHYGYRIGLFRQQSPQRWMMPTQFMSATIAVLPDTLAESLDFFSKLLTRHLIEIAIHAASSADAERLRPMLSGARKRVRCKPLLGDRWQNLLKQDRKQLASFGTTPSPGQALP